MPPPLPPITSLATHRGKFVRPRQLALYLGIPERTLRYHITKGALPAVHRGGSIMIRIEAAREYAAEPVAAAG